MATDLDIPQELLETYGIKAFTEQLIEPRKLTIEEAETAKAEFQTGVTAFKEGRYEEAKEAYLKVLQINPGDDSAHYNLAITLHLMEDYGGARAHYEKVITIKVDEPECWNNYGILLENQFNEPELARKAYEYSLKLNDQSPQAHNNYGAYLERKGDFQNAKDEFSKAVALAPEDSQFHFNYGNCAHYGLKDTDTALTEYTAAININGEYFWAYFHRGQIYLERNMIDEAMNDYLEVIKYATTEACVPIAHKNLARIYHANKKDYESAEKHYKIALALDDTMADCQNNYGTLLIQYRNDPKAAKERYEKSLALQPDKPDTLINLALIQEKEEDYENAARGLERAIELDPSKSGAHYNLAGVYFKSKKFDKAVVEYEKCIELNPAQSAVYFNLSIIYENHLKEWVKAKECLEKVIELDPTDEEAAHELEKLTTYLEKKARLESTSRQSLRMSRKSLLKA